MEAAGVSLLASPVPPSFELRVIAVAPGDVRAFVEAEWRDALVVVEHGEIELEGVSGERVSVGPGAALWLVGLSLRALRNRGRDLAVLSAVSRLGPRS